MLISLVLLVLGLVLVGFLVHLVTTKIPMDDTFRQLIIVLVVIAVIVYVLALLTGHALLPTWSGRAP